MNLRDVTFEAQNLIHAYAQTLDDGNYEQWPEFFTDAAIYQVVARDNFERNLPLATMFCDGKGMMKDRVAAIRGACVYAPNYLRHLVSGTKVLGRIDEAYQVQSSYAVLTTPYNEETKVFNTGRYLDEVVFVNGSAKFRKKVVVYDTLQIPSLLVIPL